MHRLTARILDVSNEFHNTTVPTNQRFCVSKIIYYLHWFESYFSNVPLNQDYGQFIFQYMNVIQGRKPSEGQYNGLVSAVVTMIKHKKINIDHAI